MPRKCSVCARSDRELVEAALSDGRSFRDVGRCFGVALGSLHRHKQHGRRVAVLADTGAIAGRGETERIANRGPDWIPAADDFSPLAHAQRALLEARRRAVRWVGVP